MSDRNQAEIETKKYADHLSLEYGYPIKVAIDWVTVGKARIDFWLAYRCVPLNADGFAEAALRFGTSGHPSAEYIKDLGYILKTSNGLIKMVMCTDETIDELLDI